MQAVAQALSTTSPTPWLSAMSSMWEPLIPPQPPWTLGGRWKVGDCSKSLCLQHWKRLGIVFSCREPAGGEVFLGRVLWDAQGWYLFGAFGSKQPVKGRLSIGASTASIKWPTGAQWAQEQEEWDSTVAPDYRQTRSALLGLLVVLLPGAFLQVYRLLLANVLLFCSSVAHVILAFRIMPWCTTLYPPGAKWRCLSLCCIVSVSSLMALNATAAAWLALNCWREPFGHVYLACMTLSMLCSLLYGSWVQAAESWANSQNPEEWAGVAKIPFSHAEHARVVEAFDSACKHWQHIYPFSLEVTEVFSISNLFLSARFAESHGRLASGLNITQLFYGCSASAAKAIITSGFRTPPRILGRAISFYETPLKSWQYTSKTGASYLLVCDVALGLAKGVSEERAMLSRENLQAAFSSATESDSLLGLRQEDGGILRVPAHQLLRPEQALPTFLLRLREKQFEAR
uniref:PARP catalytic domain-containing protein n=1 Tax=Alexandrium catenella TaxID=2925 RepID=A0A7S1S5T8_ALECA